MFGSKNLDKPDKLRYTTMFIPSLIRSLKNSTNSFGIKHFVIKIIGLEILFFANISNISFV